MVWKYVPTFGQPYTLLYIYIYTYTHLLHAEARLGSIFFLLYVLCNFTTLQRQQVRRAPYVFSVCLGRVFKIQAQSTEGTFLPKRIESSGKK